jgi:hypothetical protein
MLLMGSLLVMLFGLQQTFEGHYILGPVLLAVSVLGCRVTGKAINRWVYGLDD